MPETETLPNLAANRVDHLVTALKGLTGPIPIVGSLVAEAIGALIPDQRIDRLARYVTILEAKVRQLDQAQIQARFATPGFLDLFEDSLYQATRALTEERLHNIAALVKNGLSTTETSYDQHKHLLNLLGELNDTEVIILVSYTYNTLGEESAFHQQHRDLLMGAGKAHQGSSPAEWESATVHKSYRQHLARLGLLRPDFKKPKKNEFPEFDPDTGMIKAQGYVLTSLGRVFLSQLDLSKHETAAG